MMDGLALTGTLNPTRKTVDDKHKIVTKIKAVLFIPYHFPCMGLQLPESVLMTCGNTFD
jgi:hypothetical protein